MVAFDLRGACGGILCQGALRAIAVHGATDALVHPPARLAVAYAPALVAWPFTTTLFFAASVVHFSRDTNAPGSLAAHAVWLLLYMTWSMRAAVYAALGYMLAVHLPQHYRGVGRRAWPVAALSMAAALFGPPVLSLPDWAQRIVCVHVALDELRRRNDTTSAAGSTTH